MKGLSTRQAEELLQRFGKNVLQAKKSNPWWKILGSQFTDLLVLILIGAAGISYFVGESTDANVILFIVLLNAGIGFFQEFRTEKTLEALKKMLHPEIRVLRDGEEVMLPTELLVPGDIVILGEGDRVPADGKLLEAHSLHLDEAALTGESVPVEKKVKQDVMMGTSVSRGSGIFKVVETGMRTNFGKIANLAVTTKKVLSPLQKELAHIGIFVTKVTFVICLILFAITFWREKPFVEGIGEAFTHSLMFAVSVAIAAVPEGLPTTITIALALGAAVLARKKAIIKKLSSVETLGSVTTICSDKTGTLTKNQMTVREIYLADRSIYRVSGVGYDPNSGELSLVGGSEESDENPVLRDKLLDIAYYCNEAKLVKKDDRYFVLGDPTEGALLTMVEKANSEFEKEEIDEIFPFDSTRKMMSVVMDKKVLAKGSPDHILAKCTHWTDGEKTYELDEDKRNRIIKHYERMAGSALRVLAFAEGNVPEGDLEELVDNEVEKDLVFVGLVGMIDPPRDEVRPAVRKCRDAGIGVVVITGDYGATAEAVARELGIVEDIEPIVLTGQEVKKLSDEELAKILADKKTPVIFARSLPEQKMRVVRILQSQHEVVAMTGDGVNDAPALKKADIGVAMGITGTEVTKEVATMILTDDSFASIVSAVKEGRRIYDNLKKFVWFIFSCNIGELFVIFAAILLQLPLPLTAVLILAVDLGTDILPAIALGVDKGERGLMLRKPRSMHQRLLNRNFVGSFLLTGITIGVAVFGAFLIDYNVTGDLEHAQTVAFASLVFVQLLNAFSARSERVSIFMMNPFSNYFLLLAVFTSILMVLTMVYLPFFNDILHTVPLGRYDWWIVGLASVMPLIVVEGRKLLVGDEGYDYEKV